MADTIVYQKVLQLYRSNNIWQTKGLAKANIEIHAKNLHSEISKSILDGEPILGRYYDKISNYTYVDSNSQYTKLTTNPYEGASSTKHVWVEGYDEFSVMPDSFGYNSAPYFRVGSNDSWIYYQVNFISFSQGEEANATISTVFGVAYKSTESDIIYIEWFDSAAEAQAVIDNLNYTDTNVVNGFVAAVHQHKGKVEPIHGTISGIESIGVNEAAYAYVKLGTTDPTTDIEWVWDSTNTGTTKPTSGLTVTSPKYYYVHDNTDTDVNGYYELQKNIAISLKIHDENNILRQDDKGLETSLTLRQLRSSEITETNVREAYQLFGNASGTETAIGDTIKIYKDSSLFAAYLGTMDDKLVASGDSGHATETDIMYAWKGENSTYLYTTKKDGLDIRTDEAYTRSTNEKTQFLFEDGKTITNATDTTIKVDSVTYTYDEEYNVASPCVIDGETLSEALCFIYTLSDGNYDLVKIDIESFIQENEFGDGLKVTDHVVSVNLNTNGGIEFDDSTPNKALQIKIDTSNTGYYVYATGDLDTDCYLYENGEYRALTQSEVNAGRVEGNTYYKTKTYLDTTSSGLKLNSDVLETETVDNVRKHLEINGRGFRKGTDGKLSAIISSSDILVAGNEVDGTTTTMKKVVEVDFMVAGGPVSYGKVGEIFADTTSGKVFRVRQDIPSTGVNFDDTTYFESLQYDFIQFNGFVWQWDDTNTIFNKYRINDGTTVNEAIAILDHLAYHIDMGQFNIPNA